MPRNNQFQNHHRFQGKDPELFRAFEAIQQRILTLQAELDALSAGSATDPALTVDGLTVIKTAAASTSETIVEAGVSDAAGRWILGNGSAVDTRFTSRTTIVQTQPAATGGQPANEVLAVIDTENTDNDYAAHRFTTQLTGGGPLTTQKLWELVNGTNKVMFVRPVNTASPDSVTLVINNSDFGDPSYSTAGGAFSGGSRVVLEQGRSPTTVDNEIGMCSQGPYIAVRSTSLRFSLFFGTSNPFYVDGNGRVNSGSINPGTGGNLGRISADDIATPEGFITANPGAINCGSSGSIGRFSFKGYDAGTNTGWFSLHGGFIDPEGGVPGKAGALYLRKHSTSGEGSLYQKITETGSSDGGSTGWRRIIHPLEGTGDPNGVETGDPGDLYVDRAGGAGATLYVKESGTATNTGWVAK